MKRIFKFGVQSATPERSAARSMKEAVRKLGEHRRQRGTIMLLTTVMLTVLIGMLALAIDIGVLFSSRGQFQNGIDSATLAAATGLRVTIEDESMAQQEAIVKQFAVDFAKQNQVRRFADPPKDSEEENKNNIVIKSEDVAITTEINGIPQVNVNSTMDIPLYFASVLSLPGLDLSKMNIKAGSKASLFPVDGGMGAVSGCWRPLFLPDSFANANDVTNTVFYIGDPIRGEKGKPMDVPGDYYRSRFAVSSGPRATLPFVDGAGLSVTGLRDTRLVTESGVQTMMGRVITIKKDFYHIPKFSTLPQATAISYDPKDYAQFGHCGQIRVGTEIETYPLGDTTTYNNVRDGLRALKNAADMAVPQYGYVKSNNFPTPNTSPAIIPVLLYDPFQFNNSGKFTVTNIGLFYLISIADDAAITGVFVREIIVGGTPIAQENFQVDSNDPLGFQQRHLPMSVRLLR